MLEQFKESVDYILSKTNVKPSVGIVLGTGLGGLVKEIEVLKNKYNYIQEILEETLDLRKKSTAEICSILSEKGYSKIESSYNYLIKMSMDSVCEENVKHLKTQYTDKEAEYKEIERVTIQQLWSKELRELEKIL